MLNFLTASAVATTTQFTRFEALGLHPVAFNLGPLPIRWYSLGYLVGILLGYWLLTRLIRKPGSPMSRLHADDMILYATLGIILGGRFGYILFYKPEILTNPVDIFKVWEGGMSLHGGVLGTIFAIWLFARRNKLSFLRMCDYIALCIPFGLFLVRIANFINGELWGKATDVSWAIIFPTGGDVARHPSQLYEATAEGLLMGLIMWPLFYRTQLRYMPGFFFGLSALIYGCARFFIEYYREADAHLQWLPDSTGLSMGQWLTVPMILIGLYLVLTAKKRRVRVESFAGNQSVA